MPSQTTDSSVLALIATFTSALDVFKRFREGQTKKKKKKKQKRKLSEDEVRLTRSLRRGPEDLQIQYGRNYRLGGERFRTGDSRAHASLTATLLKLNSGLVGIISSFLSCGKNDAMLDYASLTSLSETSRLDAIDALSQLSYRLSQSSLSLLQPDYYGNNGRKKVSRRRKDGHQNATTVRRMQISNASEPQLVVVKPRMKRSTSSSSSPESLGRPPIASAHPARPSASKARGAPQGQFTTQRPSADSAPTPSPPITRASPVSAESLAAGQRRRADKMTPSIYTFASGSTKLGEIPMRKWNVPYDFEDMARRNAEAAMQQGNGTTSTGGGQKPRRGFFNMFKRGGGDG